MDKQNVVHPYSGILFSDIKKWVINTCYNIDEAWKRYTKWNKPDTKCYILCDSIYVKCPEEANS